MMLHLLKLKYVLLCPMKLVLFLMPISFIVPYVAFTIFVASDEAYVIFVALYKTLTFLLRTIKLMSVLLFNTYVFLLSAISYIQNLFE